jgi:hypothetical protein
MIKTHILMIGLSLLYATVLGADDWIEGGYA